MLMSKAGISLVMPLALLGLMWLSAGPETTGAPAPRKIEWLLLGWIAPFSQNMGLRILRGLITNLWKITS